MGLNRVVPGRFSVNSKEWSLSLLMELIFSRFNFENESPSFDDEVRKEVRPRRDIISIWSDCRGSLLVCVAQFQSLK